VRTVEVAVRDFEAVLLDDEAICATAGNSTAARSPPPSAAIEAPENFRKGGVIFSTRSYKIVRSNK
jgi:hypothetical protein